MEHVQNFEHATIVINGKLSILWMDATAMQLVNAVVTPLRKAASYQQRKTNL